MAMAHNKATPLSPYNSSSSSSGSSSSSSSSSSNGNNSSEAESSNPGEYYYVHEILDIRWVKDQNGQAEAQYRVRWFGYDPSNDSWEPKESFDTCQTVLQKFLDLYESLRAKKVAHLQSIGVDPDKADTRHVNILSRHIERIAQKRLKKKNISKSQTLYKVIWKDQDGYYTWETEATLIHAQDKVEEYSRKQRLMRLKVHANMREEGERKEEAGTAAAGEENPDHVRRSQERKFFENLESGELVLKGDLYTRVKSRRARTQSDSIEGSTPEKKQIEKPRSKRQNNRGASNNNDLDEKETQSKDRAEDMETEQGEREVVSRLTAGLLQYDPDEVEEEFKRMEEQTVILTEEEFHRAVYENNYKVVFDCLRSDNMPDADFTTMFLDMARRNKREVALLLAAKVPDLTVLDLWGQNALTLAAKHGNISFAYSLLRLGVPLNLRNRENQTAFDVAALYGNMPFCKFCQNFSTAQNVPLT